MVLYSRRETHERAWDRPSLAIEEITELAPDTTAWFTVVVPTRNESGNIAALLSSLRDSFGTAVAEVLFVDDSTDDTPQVIRTQGRTSGLAVRLLHREGAHRTGGLATAVIDGLRAARGTWAVVMDGDLQHPAHLVPTLVAVGQARSVDIVAASRYIGSGAASGLSGGYRHAVSDIAGALSKATFPRRLDRMSDPMSGFFAVRLAALKLDLLKPRGFKILLEIMVRQPRLRVAEVPFSFGERHAGSSKASAREGLRFLRHIIGLRLAVLRHQVKRSASGSPIDRAVRMVMFGLVGLSGLVVNTAALWAATRGWGSHHYLIGAVIATEVSTTWNFLLTEFLVFRGVKRGSRLGRAVKFYALNHIALLLRLPVLALLVSGLHLDVLLANVMTLVTLFLARFVIADSAIYAADDEPDQRQPMRIVVDVAERTPGHVVAQAISAPGKKYLPYRYDIEGLATIGSQVPLKELEYFRAQYLANDVDIAIHVGPVGPRSPRARARMTQFTSPPALTYEEHFGRLGANFHVHIGTSQIQVLASPTLAASPHVLYTNVIEALLRFVAVSRGRILLHSACLELDGQGILLSARTDTGKTGTVLRLLREKGASFLSDDMTILDSSGVATCFPKPLTISHHTLRAVQAGDLTAAEWRRLKLQSRLHSREGRQWGLLLARINVPIMGINSLIQRIVPPPKYAVDRLVDCRVIRRTTVSNLFVIERAPYAVADLDFDQTIDTLVANTDDAYGFPPFAQMAPSIVLGEDAYFDLRRKEREILVSAMGSIRARSVGSPDFSWADLIPQIMAQDPAQQPSTTIDLTTAPNPAECQDPPTARPTRSLA